jgi:glycosyltransferase involved in cell wall biosynthesis/SAM-dependent methyltransferase
MNSGSPLLLKCPLCSSSRLRYAFSREGRRIVRCSDCQLIFSNPQPAGDFPGSGDDEHCAPESEKEEVRARADEMKRETARLHLQEIQRYRGGAGGDLLEVGCGDGHLLAEAESAGFQVTGVEYSPVACANARQRVRGAIHCGEVGKQEDLEQERFDLCVLSDVIERVRDPVQFLKTIHKLLKPGGTIVLTTCSLDSWPAKVLEQDWMEFKAQHLVYFDRRTMQTALLRAGFHDIIAQPERRILSFEYAARRLERNRVPLVTPLAGLLRKILPDSVQKKNRRVVANGIMVFAHKTEQRLRQKLSVIMPAFNEASSLTQVVDAVLDKTLAALDIELIIVESNSTDGTRELAMKYDGHPRVKLILEEKPLGKGHAVRTGLEAADGDYILIQDADLEYDLEDYDALLEPLVEGREAFVLGSRHSGSVWKMRQFSGQMLLSGFLNFGHWFFAMLVNVLFGQRLKDPFTMFKVFRRDCLYGLNFKCNRFDFDFELLVKLVRKGYRPLEMPVNYRSRSFKEGKKVSMIRDPLSWLAVLFRLRMEKLDPLEEIERARAEARALPAKRHSPAAAEKVFSH